MSVLRHIKVSATRLYTHGRKHRQGGFIAKQKTARQWMAAGLREVGETLLRRPHDPAGSQGERPGAVARGCLNCHAAPGYMAGWRRLLLTPPKPRLSGAEKNLRPTRYPPGPIDIQRGRRYRANLWTDGVAVVSIQNWSDNILVVDLQDDPAFSDDLTMLADQLDAYEDVAVVLNMGGVNYVNSSNIAKLLKLRKKLLNDQHRLILCGISTNVWGLFLVTGLDKVFEFADSVATGLAAVQLAAEG